MRRCNLIPIVLQLFPALIATLSAITDGMQYGWSGPALPVLRSQNSLIKITKIDEYWLETGYLLGGLLGLPLAIYLVGAIGRRNTIIVTSCASLMSWLILAAAIRVEFLYFGRVIAGLAGHASFVATPLYLTEIAGKGIKGFLIGLDYLMMMVGILFVYTLVPCCPYYMHQVIGIVLNSIQLIVLPFMPKSPYFLASYGNLDEVKKSLILLRGSTNVSNELREIEQVVEKQQDEENFSYSNMFRNNRRAIIIVTGLVAYQHFSGFNVMLMNHHTILEDTESSFFTIEESGAIFSGFTVVSTAICSITVDKYGRKVLLIISALLTGICLLVIAIYFTLPKFGIDLKSVTWIIAVAVMFYPVAFKLGLGLVPQLLICELFTVNVKAKALAYGELLYIVFGSLTLSFYHYFEHIYGVHIPFFVFAVVCFSSIAFTIFIVPETKGKSLGEINLMLKVGS